MTTNDFEREGRDRKVRAIVEWIRAEGSGVANWVERLQTFPDSWGLVADRVGVPFPSYATQAVVLQILKRPAEIPADPFDGING